MVAVLRPGLREPLKTRWHGRRAVAALGERALGEA